MKYLLLIKCFINDNEYQITELKNLISLILYLLND